MAVIPHSARRSYAMAAEDTNKGVVRLLSTLETARFR